MQFVPDGLSPDGEELLEMLSSANLDVGVQASEANSGVNSPVLSLNAFMFTYLKTVRSGSAARSHVIVCRECESKGQWGFLRHT